MEPLQDINSENITLILRIIDKLLDLPQGEQIYGEQLRILFHQLSIATNPIFITKN